MSKRNELNDYLLKNPIDRNSADPYAEAAREFEIDRETVRNAWRRLRHKGLVEKNKDEDSVEDNVTSSKYGKEIKTTTPKQIRNEKDLAEVCNIDLEEWKIEEWECKRYNAWIKNEANQIEKKPLYSIYAKLKKRKVDTDIQKQKEILLAEIKEHLSKEAPTLELNDYVAEGLLLELALPDAHFGKLSWEDESGENYDLKIACERYKEAIANLLRKAPLESVERILLPIGNDMITIDSGSGGRKGTTTAGTPQDYDSRFRKILSVVKDLLIQVIDTLVEIAPVDIVVVSGNHDYDAMFTIGMVLEAFYHNNPNVLINNEPTQRKYYQFHKTGIMWTHGNEEPHNQLGLIFATEKPELWAATKFREAQLGHFHKNKRTQYVSVDEEQGFQVNILPSLSGTDAWHNSKGYNSLKQAKAYLYDRDEGKVAEFTYTVQK